MCSQARLLTGRCRRTNPRRSRVPRAPALYRNQARRRLLYHCTRGSPQGPAFQGAACGCRRRLVAAGRTRHQRSFGGHGSIEHDYDSIAVNAGAGHDFNQKNTTVSFNVNQELDRVNAHGGSPVPGSDYALWEKESSKSKSVTGGLIGLTQIIRRNWLTEINYTYTGTSSMCAVDGPCRMFPDRSPSPHQAACRRGCWPPSPCFRASERRRSSISRVRSTGAFVRPR